MQANASVAEWVLKTSLKEFDIVNLKASNQICWFSKCYFCFLSDTSCLTECFCYKLKLICIWVDRLPVSKLSNVKQHLLPAFQYQLLTVTLQASVASFKVAHFLQRKSSNSPYKYILLCMTTKFSSCFLNHPVSSFLLKIVLILHEW